MRFFREWAERKNLVTLKKAAFFGTAVFLQQAIFVQGGAIGPPPLHVDR